MPDPRAEGAKMDFETLAAAVILGGSAGELKPCWPATLCRANKLESVENDQLPTGSKAGTGRCCRTRPLRNRRRPGA